MPMLAISAARAKLFCKPRLHRLASCQCSATFQCGVLLTTLDVSEFTSKFNLKFDVCSDTENESYATVGTGIHNITVWLFAQRYAITYSPLPYNYSAVGNVFLRGLLNYSCPQLFTNRSLLILTLTLTLTML